jgi:hypothetical protein
MEGGRWGMIFSQLISGMETPPGGPISRGVDQISVAIQSAKFPAIGFARL